VSTVSELIRPQPIRMRHGLAHLREDLSLLRAGVLDRRSFLAGYRRGLNPVTIEHRDASGALVNLRRTFNLRTNAGGDFTAQTMAGFTTGSLAYSGQSRVATSALTATTLTDSSASPAFNAASSANVIGRLVIVSDGTATNVAYGVILSATATVLTVDKWHVIGSSTDATAALGGTGGAPAGAALSYIIPAPMAPLCYFALSSDAGAPSAADTTVASEISTNGLGRAFATGANWTHVSPTGTTQQSTVWSLKITFTATGTQASIQKCGMLNAVSGGILGFENTFSAVSMISGDTLAVTWTITG
jgi:hypothetical protein